MILFLLNVRSCFEKMDITNQNTNGITVYSENTEVTNINFTTGEKI